MATAWKWIRGSRDCNSKEHKYIIGFKIDIEMKPRYYEEFQNGARVEEAIFIPTNEKDRLRNDLAEEMGLNARAGAVVDIDWIMIDGEIHREFRFLVEPKLPCRVMFGRQPATDSLLLEPEYPFQKATKVELDRSYDFSRQRANTWERVNKKIKHRTSTWRSGMQGKDRSIRPNFLQKKFQKQTPIASVAKTEDLIPTAPNVDAVSQGVGMTIGQTADPKMQSNQVLCEDLSSHKRESNASQNPAMIDEVVDGKGNVGLSSDLSLNGCDNRNGGKERAMHRELRSGNQTTILPVSGIISGTQNTDKNCCSPSENSESLELIADRPQQVQVEHHESVMGPDASVLAKGSERQRYPSPESRGRQKDAHFRDSGLNTEIDSDYGNAVILDYQRIQQDAQAKIRARKRGKAPRIKRATLEEITSSQDLDLISVPSNDDPWTYDSSAKAYYLVNSATGSRIWYEDSEAGDADD